MNDKKLSHVDEQGRVKMVDVGAKPAQKREAIAEAMLHARPETLQAIIDGNLPKGEALAAARIAGIQAAKKCDELIPLCHTLPLENVSVSFELVEPARDRLRITTSARTTAKTGVEMEALVAATIAALTIYDMTKAVDREMRIEHVVLLSKTKSD